MIPTLLAFATLAASLMPPAPYIRTVAPSAVELRPTVGTPQPLELKPLWKRVAGLGGRCR